VRFPEADKPFYDPECVDRDLLAANPDIELELKLRTPVGGGCMRVAQNSILPVNEDYVHAWFVLFMFVSLILTLTLTLTLTLALALALALALTLTRFVSLILISVFIAIILNYYGILSGLSTTEIEVEDFSYAWIHFDPDNTAYIPVWR